MSRPVCDRFGHEHSMLHEPLEPRLMLSGTTYVIDSLADVVAADGVTTLREAIEAANTNLPVNEAPAGLADSMDIITFDPSLAGGTITLAGSQLKIADDLDIRGLGSDQLTIDADGRSRVMFVQEDVTASIDALTLTGGRARNDTGGGGVCNLGVLTITNAVISGNSVTAHRGDGGGIRNYGTLTVTGTIVKDNTTSDSAIFIFVSGGGIASSGSLMVTDSLVTGNTSIGAGGGIRSWGETTIVGTVITDNTGGYGAGIFLSGVSFISNTMVAGNSAGEGGGLGISGRATITNSTFCRNVAWVGGAIYISGEATITNSTIRGNTAWVEGGGLYIDDPDPDSGDAPEAVLTNTVIAGNTADLDADIRGDLSPASANYFIGAVDGEPLLTAVTDSEGMILYYVPQAGSPLLNAGDNSLAVDHDGFPLTTDQRGRTRIVDGVVDIGAVELSAEPELAITPTTMVEIAEGESYLANVSLTSAPMQTLTVMISREAGGSQNVSADSSSLTFDASNWDIPQTVEIIAAEDADRDNDAASILFSGPATEPIRVHVMARDNDYQTYVVDSLVDTVADDGQLTLREAIEAANTNTAVNEAPEGCEGAADIIIFHPFLIGGTIGLSGEMLAITETLEIRGPGSDRLIINGNNLSSVFYVSDTAAKISGLTITGGNAYYINSSWGPPSTQKGGGIGVWDHAEVTLANVTVSGNMSTADGGGIYVDYHASLTATNTTVSDNVSLRSGAGITTEGGTVTLTNCTVVRNRSIGEHSYVGGISVPYSQGVTLNNTIVAENESTNAPKNVRGSSVQGSGNLIGGDPMLSAVTDANGTVLYYMPLPSSPLLDAGENALAVDPDGEALITDQRGHTRLVGANVDIGAIERPVGPELVISPVPCLEVLEGESAALTVSLTAPPPTTVGVTFIPQAWLGADSIMSEKSSLFFDATNWNVPQSMMMIAAEDADRDNDVAVFRVVSPAMQSVYVRVEAIDDDGQTYVVNSLGDQIAPDGVVTLREALEAANTNTSIYDAPEGCEGIADVITFDPAILGGAIVLGGTQLVITDDVEILGPGVRHLTIDANDQSRVIFVAGGVSTRLEGMMITGGNTFEGDVDGGGIYNQGNLDITAATVFGNTTYDNGGSGVLNRGNLTLTNTTISSNSVKYGGFGGGVYNEAFSSAVLTNSTVIGNSGYGIWCQEGADITVSNTVALGFVYLSDMYSVSNSVIGNQEGDLMLTTVSDADGRILYYMPQPGSPLIDAGGNALAVDHDGTSLAADTAGNPRIIGLHVDIGAFEYQGTPGDADTDGDVDMDDFVLLKQNYLSGPTLWSEGDFNGDGVTDLDDFVLLKQNFLVEPAATPAPAAATVAAEQIAADEPAPVAAQPALRRARARRLRRAPVRVQAAPAGRVDLLSMGLAPLRRR